MALGECSSDDSRTDGSEQEEPQEPVCKRQITEQDVFVAGFASNGHLAGALRVKRLAPEAILPTRGSKYAAGYDLSSAYQAIVPARGKAMVKTELSIAIPEGTYARVAPRSGLTWKNSIDVGAGVIDYDYRGPVSVILFNHSDTDFHIKEGDRIAQLILEMIAIPEVVEVDSLDSTDRGDGGFGSTGVAKKVDIVAVAVAEVEASSPDEDLAVGKGAA